MRTPGAVYRQLKEVKYRHLISLYKKYLQKEPRNCKYNKCYKFLDSDGKERSMLLCTLHQKGDEITNLNLLDVCELPKHYQNCNAFSHKYTKQDIKGYFSLELQDKKKREKEYPDICALEWVLTKSSPIASGWSKVWFLIKTNLWKN